MHENDKNWILENAQNGIITSRQVTEKGIYRRILSQLVSEGTLVRYSRGVYLKVTEWEDELTLLQHKYPRGIFSHATALYLFGFSERVPLKYHMTFPTNYNAPSLKDENVTVTRVITPNYSLGITTTLTPAGNQVTTYDMERSLCDILRGSGDDLQVIQYAMKKYASSKDKDINKLMAYAKQLHVEPKVRRYMEVLL